MLPTFSFSKAPFIDLMIRHACELVTMLHEQDLLTSVSATLSERSGVYTTTWSASGDLHEFTPWRLEPTSDVEHMVLDVELIFRPDLSLPEYIRILYVIRHMNFSFIQPLYVERGDLLLDTPMTCTVMYYADFEPGELSWPSGL